MRTVRVSLLVIGLVGISATASHAQSPGYSINVTPPPSLSVGQPGIFQASGSNPADDFFSSWLDVAAIPTSVLPSCPADYLQANQIASSSYAQGGDVVVTGQRENVDAAGNWSQPFAFTPTKPGRFLICAYTNDGATYTHAMAALTVTVSDASGAAKPANVERPRVVVSRGRLECKRGRWSNRPTRYSYRWLVNGKRKQGANSRRLALTRSLRGRTVRCKVTAGNPAGAASALSRPLRVD